MKYFILSLAGFFALTISSLRAEDAQVIKFSDLPTIVQRSVLGQTKMAAIKKVELIDNEGLTKYEVETRSNHINLDISLAQNGAILELEKTITPTALSTAAIRQIKQDYPKIIIHKVEAVQKFYYDVAGTVEGRPVQFKVMATGDIEDEPKEAGQKD